MSAKYSVLQVNIKLLPMASDLSGTNLDMTGIEVEEHELEEEENCIMVSILAREKVETNSVLSSGFRLNVVFEKTLKDEKLLLLRKVIVTLNIFIQNR